MLKVKVTKKTLQPRSYHEKWRSGEEKYEETDKDTTNNSTEVQNQYPILNLVEQSVALQLYEAKHLDWKACK